MIKNNRGSLTITVIFTILIFSLYGILLYARSSSSYIRQTQSIETIQKIYAQDVPNALKIAEQLGASNAYANGSWDTVEAPGKGINNTFKWEIYTPAQLKFLQVYVNNGNNLNADLERALETAGYDSGDVTMTTETTVFLMNNLDLSARPGSGSTPQERWETTENNDKNWVPIGTSGALKFIGIFEGNNHTISGVYVNSTTTDRGYGLFGWANKVQNLTIKDSYIKGCHSTGGIAGVIAYKITNCHNKNTTVTLREGSYYRVGGVAGTIAGETSNCTNTGTVICLGNYSGYNYCGGVFGDLQCSGENCINYGSVIGSGNTVGGVVGLVYGGRKIENFSNYGTVTGNNYVGGVTASINKEGVITNCYNSGNISGDTYVGGINGAKGASVSITNCYSKGNITGNTYIGAVSGSISDNYIFQNLYYLSSVGIGAVEGADYPDQNAGPIDNNFNSLEEFLSWLGNQ